jgi:hypothetical protein
MHTANTLPTTGMCTCGAILAKVCMGANEAEDNEFLKYKHNKPFIDALDKVRAYFQDPNHDVTSKEAMLVFLDTFQATRTSGVDEHKFVLLGTDQRSTTRYGSDSGCIGLPPFCLNLLCFILGNWEHWDNKKLTNEEKWKLTPLLTFKK